MKKKMIALGTMVFLTVILTVATQAATTIDVAIMEDGYYFHGPFAGTQLWVDEEIAFRDHPAFDAQGYMKFDLDAVLAGFNAEDIIAATLEYTTYHKDEDIENRTWGSPPNGTQVTLAVEPYASAVNMSLTTEPSTVKRLTYPFTCKDIDGAADGDRLKTARFDVTEIVRDWVAGDYDNHGLKLDLLGAPAGDKYYLWVFATEDHSYIPTLKVRVKDPQPVDPSVNISVRGLCYGANPLDQYAPGDVMRVVLETSPGTGDNSWNVYVGLILPDKSLYIVLIEPSLGLVRYESPDDLAPVRPLRPITEEAITILDFTVPPLPAGKYQWLAVLEKDNWGQVSDISWGSCTILEE